MTKAAFIYEDRLSSHVLREDHVMRPTRLRYTYELLEAYGAFHQPDSFLVNPKEAQEEDLLLVHSSEYIEAVRSISRGERRFNPARYNFSEWGDNPPYEGMYEASVLAVGASLTAAELVMDGKVEAAFNVSGGLHHAARDHASGFCIFNDPAIAIARLVEKGLKVAYVDIDAHHGDGVQNAFYATDRILTISLHESGRYLFPGTGEVAEMGEGDGRGYSVNLPLAPYTDDDVYLWAFEAVVPPLLDAFRPDMVVTQLGVDAHYLDPLAHLNLTTKSYSHIVERCRGLAPRWVALGGGGYNMEVVPRVWAMEYGIMLGKGWPDKMPPEYVERYGLRKLRDQDKPAINDETKDFITAFARESVEKIRQVIFPIHGL